MDSKKKQIIQAALKRFSHYGFNKTTMNEIAVDANITKANLYYYYPEKNSLIKDVLACLSDEILAQQLAVLSEYKGDLQAILYRLLELKASFLKDHYVLHISENLEWLKGRGVASLLEQFHQKNVEIIEQLLIQATAYGEVTLSSVKEAATSYTEIMEGLSLIGSVKDMISGMPNAANVDLILQNQRKATKFIFENKIKEKN